MSDKPGRLVNPIWIKALCEEDVQLPKYQTPGSVGCDLQSAESHIVKPGQRTLVGTGLKLEIPYGIGAYICPRSGLAAKHGITVLNSPGIIDSDYRGELKVILFNSGNEDFVIKKGDRIAQLLFFPIFQAIFQKTKVVAETQRGEGGFGSTGITST